MNEDPYRRLVRADLAPMLEHVPKGPEWEALDVAQLLLSSASESRSLPGWVVAVGSAAAVLAVVGLSIGILRATSLDTQSGTVAPSDVAQTTAAVVSTTTLNRAPAGWTLLPEWPLTARDGHSVVWTGREVVVWGGNVGGDSTDPYANPFANGGAAYNPAQRSWKTIAVAPIGGRLWHSAVWTGEEILIWGGFGDDEVTDAAAYDPATDSWRSVAASPIAPRWWGHSTTWTGTEMIIWGRRPINSDEPTGVAYTPRTDTWRDLPEAPIASRDWHSAVWTGDELIIWGGERSTSNGESVEYMNDGAAFNPISGTWRQLAPSPLAGRWQHTAVWTGEVMIIWGGAASDGTGDALADGAVYDPATDSWFPLPPGPLVARGGHTAFWTDQGMLIWGGEVRTSGSSWAQFADGAIFDPTSASWTPIVPASVTGTRDATPSVWTGDQLIYWGRGDDFEVTGGESLSLGAP